MRVVESGPGRGIGSIAYPCFLSRYHGIDPGWHRKTQVVENIEGEDGGIR